MNRLFVTLWPPFVYFQSVNTPSSHAPTKCHRAQDEAKPPTARRLHATPRFNNVRRQAYQSLAQLKTQFDRLDEVADPMQLTVVLVLDERSCGHLSSIISRCDPALRLVIVAPSGWLPGPLSRGDLAMMSSALGWQEIVVAKDLDRALTEAR